MSAIKLNSSNIFDIKWSQWYILHLLKYLTFFSLNVKLFFLHDQSYPQLALGHNIFKFAFINTILILKIIFNCI